MSEFGEATIEDVPAAPQDTAALMLCLHEAVHAPLVADRVHAIQSLGSYLSARQDDDHLDEVVRTLIQAAEFDETIWGRHESMQILCFQVSEDAFDAFLRLGPLDPDEPVRWLWVRRLETLADPDRFAAFLRPSAARDKPLSGEKLSQIRRERIAKAVEKLDRLVLVEPDTEIKEKAQDILAKLKQ